MIINLTDLMQKLMGYSYRINNNPESIREIADEMTESCKQAAQVINAQRNRYVSFVMTMITKDHARICRMEECNCIGVTVAKLTKAEWQLAEKLGYKSELQ